MIEQRFQAPTMTEALEAVQRELGPDALVISAREVPGASPWQIWRSRSVEILAQPGSPSLKAQMDPSESPSNVMMPWDRYSSDKNLDANPSDHQLPQGEEKVAKQKTSPDWMVELRAAYTLLKNQGLDHSLLKKVITNSIQLLSPTSLRKRKVVQDHIKQQLKAELRTKRPSESDARKVICFIGSNGSGRTTAAAKLAKLYMGEQGKKVAWVCANSFHLSAIAEARIITETFGFPLRIAYSPDDLSKAISDFSDADTIIVDTPACNPRHETDAIELGAYLTALTDRITYVVAPATTKEEDLSKSISTFSLFNPTGLIISKLDQTTTYGSTYNIAWRSQLPLVYFTSSSDILNGFANADARLLVHALFSGRID